MLEKFEAFIAHHHLFTKDHHLFLAVSGGVDSVALVQLCYQAGYNFSIVHCNFQLRGAESDTDETWVQSLAEKYQVPFYTKRFETETYAAEKKLSIQEAARILRYEWFHELLNINSYRLTAIVTAHHADDNNETLLMNFFRGTGLHGLTGIAPSNGNIKRPLLGFTKAALISYANENQLAWREDSSNQSSKYTRNFFRNEIIPAIEKVYPQVKENLQDNIQRFREIEKLYHLSTQFIIKKLCRQKGAELHIPVKQLLDYNNRALIYQIISQYGFTEKQVDEVYRLCSSESGKYITSPDSQNQILKHRHWLIIAPVADTSVTYAVIEQTGSFRFPLGELTITAPKKPGTITDSQHVAVLDAAQLVFPLMLRKWKTGDYFYPLGMKKKKKLARFFIDQKLSKTQKENIWLLESNKKIVWVIGQRIDDRFKVIPSTKQVVEINFTAL